MEDLKDFDFKKTLDGMIYGFGGIKDTDAICNIKINGKLVQVSLCLIDSDESDFNDYDGVPFIDFY